MEDSSTSPEFDSRTDPRPPYAGTDGHATRPFAHLGLAGELFSITLVNLALKAVTLGLYHFWAKTRVRRYVWSQTSFAGERFEYTGRGPELLRGFVVSLVLVAPLLFAWGYPQIAAPETAARYSGVLWLLDFAASLYLVFLMGLARYSARRYLLSHTRWRGIRFALTGSALEHGWRMLAYSFLAGLTGGLYTPFMRNHLAGNILSHTWFGDRRFEYDGNGWPLLRRFWVFIGLVVLLAIVWVPIGLFSLGALITTLHQLFGAGQNMLIVGVGLGLLIFYAAWVMPWFWYRAGELRYFFAHTTFGGVRFSADFKTWDFIRLRTGNGAAVTLSLGLAYPWAVVRTARFLAAHVKLEGEFDPASIGQSPEEVLKAGEGLAEALGASAI